LRLSKPTGPAVSADRPDEAILDALLTVLRIARVLERIDAGVSPQQYRMLKLIGEGGERSARLAERLAVARPTLTSTADSLVAAGLAIRQAEPGDRRVVRLCLTPAGQAAVRRADDAYAAWFGSVLQHTGHGAEIIADLLSLDDAMTERRRARLAAEATAEGAPAEGTAAARSAAATSRSAAATSRSAAATSRSAAARTASTTRPSAAGQQ
jgi:DNA-binding MarR family transcriptional regulator